jgi:hypothetical protein
MAAIRDQDDDSSDRKKPERGLFGKAWFWLLGAVGGAIGTAVIGAIVPSSLISKPIAAYFTKMQDDLLCGGGAAMSLADQLHDQAVEMVRKDPVRADAVFKEANDNYRKAYACGFPDAGLRLAVAYCLGLGTKEDRGQAHRLILAVESSNVEKSGRASTARRTCQF